MTRVLLTLVLALRVGMALAAEPLQVRVQSTQFVGAAGCKSSSCHGGAGESGASLLRGRGMTFTRAGMRL